MTPSDIKKSLDKKGLYFCLQEASKRLLRLRWVPNKKIMDLIFENRSYNYLKRKYIPRLNDYTPPEENPAAEPYRIWVCWLQGEESAPELVKACIKSIRAQSPELEVVVITNENIESYIHIPEYITKRLNKKQMQYAQYSDYIRISLLARHGGIWIDSTVLLTSEIPHFVLQQPLFCFQSSPLSPSKSHLSSWFLAAQKGNPLILKMKFLLEEYWKRESRLCDYFLFHLLFSALIDCDKECSEIWDKIPYIGNGDCHLLQMRLFDKFGPTAWEHICSLSFAHKLTYKFRKGAPLETEGTYYSYIMSLPRI